VCQRCLKQGHETWTCHKQRPYVSRPTRSQALTDPKALKKFKSKGGEDIPEDLR
ncbi:hypothetical protein K437DRAFT_216900, partial [Tilletiaria anomala UBC 951]